MPDEPSEDQRDVARGAAIGMAARRGLFGGQMDRARERARKDSSSGATVTAIAVVVVLVGMLVLMIYMG